MGAKRQSSIDININLKSPIFGVRHMQCFLIFCGLCLIYAMREYKWSEQTKSHILSSFFCGYVFAQIPAGAWSRRFGGHLILLMSASLSSMLALLTPLSADVGDWPLLCALRFFQGLFQGATSPALATLMAKWAPIEERSAMLTYCSSGLELGIVIMLATSGMLSSSSWGWPSTFYIPGGLGLLWSVIWFLFGASTPNDCKYLSPAERTLISISLDTNGNSEKCNTVVHLIPWKAILASRPFLVLVLSQCASSWCFWTLLTQIPSYIKSVLGKDIQSNAYFSALPYLMMLLLSLTLCPIASYLEKSKRLKATVSRKIFNTIGQWVPAVTLVYLGFLRTDEGDLAIVLLTLTVTISTVTHFGFQVNHLDLSPHFAGTLMGIANSAAYVMSFIAPLLVGYIVTDTTNLHQWRIIFSISGAFSFFGNLFFLFFGTAKVQPWNDGSQNNNKVKPHNKIVKSSNSQNSV
ncbi:sialin-like isoform X2 [Eurosta solidaginis]|uniref:sialin-like isoform X2 n=1 Tax=Eurosta solidaginis TaxID=178769 RepID=UPI003530DEA7